MPSARRRPATSARTPGRRPPGRATVRPARPQGVGVPARACWRSRVSRLSAAWRVFLLPPAQPVPRAAGRGQHGDAGPRGQEPGSGGHRQPQRGTGSDGERGAASAWSARPTVWWRAAREAYAGATGVRAGGGEVVVSPGDRRGADGATGDRGPEHAEGHRANPSYAPAHWRLGLWLLDADDTDGAERAFCTRQRAEPSGSRRGTSASGASYLQRHDDQRAADVLERTLAKSPGDRYAMQLLGTAYRRLGRRATKRRLRWRSAWAASRRGRIPGPTR